MVETFYDNKKKNFLLRLLHLLSSVSFTRLPPSSMQVGMWNKADIYPCLICLGLNGSRWWQNAFRATTLRFDVVCDVSGWGALLKSHVRREVRRPSRRRGKHTHKSVFLSHTHTLTHSEDDLDRLPVRPSRPALFSSCTEIEVSNFTVLSLFLFKKKKQTRKAFWTSNLICCCCHFFYKLSLEHLHVVTCM